MEELINKMLEKGEDEINIAITLYDYQYKGIATMEAALECARTLIKTQEK